MQYSKLIPVTGTLALVAACGGGGGSGETELQSFLAANSASPFLSGNIEPGADTSRSTGSATYSGVTALVKTDDPTITSPDIISDPDYLGAVEIGIDFETNIVTGTIDDFEDADGEEVDGEVELTNGVLQRATLPGTVPGIGANLEGEIDDITVEDGGMLGLFEGDDTTIVGRVSNGASVSADDRLQGVFYVEE